MTERERQTEGFTPSDSTLNPCPQTTSPGRSPVQRQDGSPDDTQKQEGGVFNLSSSEKQPSGLINSSSGLLETPNPQKDKFRGNSKQDQESSEELQGEVEMKDEKVSKEKEQMSKILEDYYKKSEERQRERLFNIDSKFTLNLENSDGYDFETILKRRALFLTDDNFRQKVMRRENPEIRKLGQPRKIRNRYINHIPVYYYPDKPNVPVNPEKQMREWETRNTKKSQFWQMSTQDSPNQPKKLVTINGLVHFKQFSVQQPPIMIKQTLQREQFRRCFHKPALFFTLRNKSRTVLQDEDYFVFIESAQQSGQLSQEEKKNVCVDKAFSERVEMAEQ